MSSGVEHMKKLFSEYKFEEMKELRKTLESTADFLTVQPNLDLILEQADTMNKEVEQAVAGAVTISREMKSSESPSESGVDHDELLQKQLEVLRGFPWSKKAHDCVQIL